MMMPKSLSNCVAKLDEDDDDDIDDVVVVVVVDVTNL
jgi:hypothetical protein